MGSSRVLLKKTRLALHSYRRIADGVCEHIAAVFTSRKSASQVDAADRQPFQIDWEQFVLQPANDHA